MSSFHSEDDKVIENRSELVVTNEMNQHHIKSNGTY